MEETQSPERKAAIRDFVQALVTALASILLAALAPVFSVMFRGLSTQRATGLTAVAGGVMEFTFSPWYWLVFLIAFGWFYSTARLGRRLLRVILFWVPAVAILVLGTGTWMGFAVLLSRAQAQ
jgi:hypothetical protein